MDRRISSTPQFFRGQSADCKCGSLKGPKRHPILWICNIEAEKGWQEEKVQAGHCHNGGQGRLPETAKRRRCYHNQQVQAANRGQIDLQIESEIS